MVQTPLLSWYATQAITFELFGQVQTVAAVRVHLVFPEWPKMNEELNPNGGN
jgi:hypothetical protein